MAVVSLWILLVIFTVRTVGESSQYCIIGAGPGGLQIGYFFHREGRNYTVFERNSTAGSFFLHYPRHRTLISINKRHTGSTNKEFNFRHDWNSLITHNQSLQMKYYSKKYFPHADDYVRYLQDFASGMNIHYNTEITSVDKLRDGSFHLLDQKSNSHHCKVLVISTGVWVPNVPQDLKGVEHTVGYESVSVNPEDFEGKVVLILGRGNSGFETAANIVGNTAYIHMAARSRLKQAYQTHYVGDIRAVNNELIDTYQLKSLDGQVEIDSSNYAIERRDGKLYIKTLFEVEDRTSQHPYDCIIRCLGFTFDFSIFNDSVKPLTHSSYAKYPRMSAKYEAENVPNMFFAGTVTHSLDYRKAAGGFIHGFRYTAQALSRHLEWRYHGMPWPSVVLPISDLLDHLVKRINEASGPYQMFGVLADFVLIRGDGTIVYLEEVPIDAMGTFKEMTGHEIGSFILWNFEYGEGYSGPGEDVLRRDRAIGDPLIADQSNFLHPVLYFYSSPHGDSLKSYHHIVENFLTDWTDRKDHILPLRRFLESVFEVDLTNYFAEDCFEFILLHGTDIPPSCQQHYLQGYGLSDDVVEVEGYADSSNACSSHI